MTRTSSSYGNLHQRFPRRRRTGKPALPGAARLAIGLALLALIALTLMAILGFFAYFQISERIIPGIYVGESRLGWMSVTQAAIELQKTWNLDRKIAVSDGIHTWAISPSALGLSVDSLETAQVAHTVGHDQNLFAEVDQMVRSMNGGWGIAPVVIFDPEAATAGLEALAPLASLAPVDASLHVDGENLVAIPGEVGYTINVQDTLAQLADDPRGVMMAGYFKLSLKPVIPRVNDVSAAMAEAERILASPVQIKAYDPISDEWQEWSTPRQVIARWLKIEPGPDGPQIGIDENQVAEYVSELGKSLGPERWLDASQYQGSYSEAVKSGQAITYIVKHKPTTYLVQSGDTLIKIGWKVGMPYWKLLEANPGLDENALYVGQEIIVPSKDELLPLPVVLNKRIVISISKQRLWVYQDGELLSKNVISTGIDRSPTQPGVFQVQTHELNAYASVWDLYMPHFLGIYEAWPGFMNGMHGLPTLSNGRRLWANILGRPASYGCIILDLNAAEKIYNWAENGVVVEIQP